MPVILDLRRPAGLNLVRNHDQLAGKPDVAHAAADRGSWRVTGGQLDAQSAEAGIRLFQREATGALSGHGLAVDQRGVVGRRAEGEVALVRPERTAGSPDRQRASVPACRAPAFRCRLEGGP